MKRLLLTVTTVLLLVVGAAWIVSLRAIPFGHRDATNTQKTFPIVELADLIVAVLPPNGFADVKWDYMVDNPIIDWQTVGIEPYRVETQGYGNYRLGLVRVQVAGVMSQVLRQKWEEMPWGVALRAPEPRYGAEQGMPPQWIEVRAGNIYTGDTECYGNDVKGCTFSVAQALDSPQLQSHPVCGTKPESGGGFGLIIQAYSVSAAGKKPSLLVYRFSGGNHYSSQWLEIRPLGDQPKICDEVSRDAP